MRLCALILAATAFAAFAETQRDQNYDRLRDDSLASRLIEEVADDISMHRYEDALKKADTAAALRPGNAVALNARGAALSRLRRFGDAEAALKAAVTADPKAFPPRYNLAELLYLQGRYLDAIAELLSVQSSFGPLPLVKLDIFLCYALADRKQEAAASLAELRFPQDGAAWYYAQAADRLLAGKTAEARRLMKVADAIDKDDAQPYRETLVDFGLIK